MTIDNSPLMLVQEYARDLAWGALHNEWDSYVIVGQHENLYHGPVNVFWKLRDLKQLSENQLKFREKWIDRFPSISLLAAFRYLLKSAERGTKLAENTMVNNNYLEERPAPFEIEYIITAKAFALLEKPATPPSVFISYKREYSSAFALLIEAKLKLRDSNIGVFIDKLIKPGDDWEENIHEKIRQSRYFICLLAPQTYTDSEWVRKELEWAYDAGCEIISVFHAGAELNERYPVWLGKKQIIKVDFETAKHYESALDEILVGLGYSTY